MLTPVSAVVVRTLIGMLKFHAVAWTFHFPFVFAGGRVGLLAHNRLSLRVAQARHAVNRV